MPKKSGISIRHRRALNRLFIAGTLPAPDARLTPGQWLKTLRVAYHMTQRQLARRSGAQQGHIALMEQDRLSPRIDTLSKLFGALFCDVIVLPVPRKRPGDIMRELTMGVPTSRMWELPGDRKTPCKPRGRYPRPSRRLE